MELLGKKFTRIKDGSLETLEFDEMDRPYIWGSVTGIDGCGKTSASQFLNAVMGPGSFWWKHPNQDWVREKAWEIGDSKAGVDIEGDAELFAKAHKSDQALIRQLWSGTKFHEPNTILTSQRGPLDFYAFLELDGLERSVCDAYLGETVAVEGGPYEGRFVVPNYIVWLEVDSGIALRRIRKGDKWETSEFLARLSRKYRFMFEEDDLPSRFQDTRVYRVEAYDYNQVLAALDLVAVDVQVWVKNAGKVSGKEVHRTY